MERKRSPSPDTARTRTRAQILIASITALCLAGCAREPTPLLHPTLATPGAQTVSLLAATTRAEDANPGIMFSGDRASDVAIASIDVSIPPVREVGAVQWPRSTPADPSRFFTVSSAGAMNHAQARKWLATHAGRQRRVFVYVHGFNVQFGQGVFRFAQMMHDSKMEAAPVLFSWPSRGRLLDYKRDLDNATYSRTDLADLLRLAAESRAVDEIVVFAHSMGSWLAVEAIRQLALEKSPATRKIKNLILASPDLDVGVFRRQMMDMGPRKPALTLFISQADRALRLSQLVARGGVRLGAIDLSADHYREQLNQLRDVTVIDLSELRQGDRINHSLYASSPEAVRLIGQQLVAGRPLDEADTGGFQVVEGIGSAARFIIATPVLILDAASERQ